MLLKEQKFTTEWGGYFTISIGDFSRRILFNTENDTVQFTKDELEELINILSEYYERLD
jgi:hypothetical protein